ncbi:MAG: hypothetical protein JW749_12020 [Sedimentisphaerales bacterium]|nr:hypothetical protein [Sedimentisphaerales bacterium]
MTHFNKYKTENRNLSAISLAKLKTINGFILPMVIVAMVILIILAVGEMMSCYHYRIKAVRTKAETEAMLAAEAGYERALFWMSQQSDILGALQAGGGSGTINFGTSGCSYEVSFLDFIGARPVFRILVTGISGKPAFSRIVDVAVMQEVTGWAMGVCMIPDSPTTLIGVYFADSEIIDIPIHINDQHETPDAIDIFLIGSPKFLRKVEMGESRHTTTGTDKYGSVMSCFEGGIYFNQPYIRITNEAAVQSKVNRFRDSTKAAYRFTSDGTAGVTPRCSAVQLEFFVEANVGKVRITNHCTVMGFQQNNNNRTKDFKIVPGSGGASFQRYDIYAYHYKPTDVTPVVATIEDTYVTQSFGGEQSEPGGQIYVDGSVVIGSCDYEDMVVKGKITVVATGNIWIADNIVVDGQHDANGLPVADNPNILGLMAQGVIKVVDPGMSNYASGNPNNYPGPAPATTTDVADANASSTRKHRYKPVCNGTSATTNVRILPDPTIIEAALTVGGGGWGAENVERQSGSNKYGNRKENPTPAGNNDTLIVRGSISEAVRGAVGLVDADGYLKTYRMDNRLTEGLLPGDIWFSGKFVPAPAGWQDYRASN